MKRTRASHLGYYDCNSTSASPARWLMMGQGKPGEAGAQGDGLRQTDGFPADEPPIVAYTLKLGGDAIVAGVELVGAQRR